MKAMTRREVIRASEEHEKSFREAFELRPDLKGDPEWEMAYEYAATHKLYPDEMSVIGAAIVNRLELSNGEESQST